MKYDPNIHHRRSIRLKHFDYRQDGFYFITLCCKDNVHFFGEIIDDHMQLNEIGKIAQKCWYDIPNHFENVELHEFVIMPNHIHFIIEIVGAKYFSPHNPNEFMPNRPKGTSQTIGSIVRGFKVGVTKWVRQNTHIHTLWQRNYYEHIIRTEESYHKISDYIKYNPLNWRTDRFYS